MRTFWLSAERPLVIAGSVFCNVLVAAQPNSELSSGSFRCMRCFVVHQAEGYSAGCHGFVAQDAISFARCAAATLFERAAAAHSSTVRQHFLSATRKGRLAKPNGGIFRCRRKG